MNYEDIDKIKVSSKLDDTIKTAIEEGYRKKNKLKIKNKWKKGVVAAALALMIGTTGVTVAFPTYAKEIPIIGNIFEYISKHKDGNYIKYKEYSKSLNMAKEDEGIKFTLNDAIYDGKTVMITYTIESKKDLGEKIFINDWINIKGYRGGMSGSSGVYKIRKNTYIGFTKRSINKVKDNLNVKWEIDNIGDNNDLNIKGNWNFKFNIKKTDSDINIVNKGVSKEGINLNVDKINFTPISTVIDYSQQISKEAMKGYDDAYTRFVEVKDDLGNVYSGDGNGGYGTKDIMNFSATYEKIDKKATKLIITPKVEFMVLGEDGHRMIGTEIFNSDEKDVLNYLRKKGTMPKEVSLDDIIIDLK